ncbi:MAG: hypothetical protein ACOY41_07815 [Pseudomonadota bacterium]
MPAFMLKPPCLADWFCGVNAVTTQRQKVVALASGGVLGIGVGTGLNLEHYDKAKVEGIIGLDPGAELQGLARKRRKVFPSRLMPANRRGKPRLGAA